MRYDGYRVCHSGLQSQPQTISEVTLFKRRTVRGIQSFRDRRRNNWYTSMSKEKLNSGLPPAKVLRGR